MSDQIKYTCASCGLEHEEWPAIAFDSPTSFHVLSDQLKKEIGELDSDFCVVRHPDQTDRFIRATLTQKVIDHCENLEYGLWVSLSEKNFQEYADNFKNQNLQTKYFGWLSNDIPEYEFLEGIPTTVFTKTGNARPEIVPHKDFDHPFVKDYYNGITKQEAENRIKAMLNITSDRDKKISKPWWKFW